MTNLGRLVAKQVSSRCRCILDINERHVFHDIEDIICEVSQPMQEGTAVFDREEWLMNFIAENRDKIGRLLDETEENQRLFQSYQNELAAIPACNNRLFQKLSDKAVQSEIQNPALDPRIWVRIEFTNHGRVVIVRHDKFEIDDIETCYVGGHISSQGMSNEIVRPEGMSLMAFHKALADSQCACCFCDRIAADGAYLSVYDFGHSRICVICDDCRKTMTSILN